ncbi:FAR-17a/AIG1-like protein [Caenorhabditis elegans]|uniref:FAR-17a/AIG1-like protein n=1 Tax=Caenorhabditis elegans TaxID=6239 RepID=A0A3B1E3W8_CAEEL|nr:FAR-17a/AIG1-like protein [Caenorhabditis elegans]VAY52601.1 FAR-17a/AIG1-like protein [Caenorhabditis elegans]|eukprot:NP_001355467.1 Uncharacterized protein CELE_C37E2.10 [Caenorhabditis elegans]
MTIKSQYLFIVIAILWAIALYNYGDSPDSKELYIFRIVKLTNIFGALYSVSVVDGYQGGKSRKFVDFLHFTVMFPVAAISFVLFWALFVFDRTLVIPQAKLHVFRWLLCHFHDTYPLLYALLDSYFHKRKVPDHLAGLVISATLVFIYFMTARCVKFVDSGRIYPIFQTLSVPQFALIAFATYFLTFKAAVFINQFFHKFYRLKSLKYDVSSIQKTKKKRRHD